MRIGAGRRVGAVLAAAAIAAPAAAASPPRGPVSPAAIGGAQLAGRGVLVNYPSGSVPRLPKVKASAWVIADAGTGQVLAAKDPHGWYRPASTLKVLTAISLIPLLNPNAMVVASKQATTVSPNIVGLLAGHAYKVSDLFTALLTISANDAAMALAQATGSLSQGMAVINAEARHLQADDTVAVTPNGLDAPGQHTSAYDLALFARQGLRMPAFLKYDQTTSGAVPDQQEEVGRPVEPELAAGHVPGRDRRQDRLDQRGRRHLRRDGQAARRHADRDPAALPGADRDRRGQEPAELGLRGRREGQAGGHAGRPAAAAGPAAARRPRPGTGRRTAQRGGPARSRWAPALRCWPRPGSAAWRCSPRASASPTAAASGRARAGRCPERAAFSPRA